MSISNHARCALERVIIRKLIRELAEAGFAVHSVAHDEYVNVATEDEAMREVFAVDDCTLRFRDVRDRRKDPYLFGVLIVGGNSEDIISDWTASGEFSAAVERVTDWVERADFFDPALNLGVQP